jgi:hypothetical protein
MTSVLRNIVAVVTVLLVFFKLCDVLQWEWISVFMPAIVVNVVYGLTAIAIGRWPQW